MRGNRITCVIAVAAALSALVATNRPEAAGFLALAVCVPAASVLIGLSRASRTGLSFELGRTCVVGEKLTLRMGLERSRLLKSRVELVFEAENLLLGTLTEIPVSLSPAAGSPERYELELRTDCPGTVRLRLVSARVRDVLGLAEAPVPGASFSGSYTVYPELCDLHLRVKLAGARGEAGADFDLDRPGNDRSEVLEIREFRQGDSLKNVHWKLSARHRELMVRVPSRPSSHDVAIIFGAHPVDEADPERVRVLVAELSLLASVSLGLLRAGVPHPVAIAGTHGLRTVRVEGPESYYEMLDAVLSLPLQEKVLGNAAEFRGYCLDHGVSKTVVVTDLVSDEMFSKLGGAGELSVVHVTPHAHTGVDEGASCLLLHVPADDVPARIRSLEL